MLATKDIATICGLPPTTLIEWIAKGHVAPTVRGGVGRGNPHRFDLMASVGLVVGARTYTGEHGCIPSYVGLVVAGFAAMAEADLLRLFAEGKTRMAGLHQGRPCLQEPQLYEQVDVKDAYDAVKETMTTHEEDRK